jgi:hypothetical protein
MTMSTKTEKPLFTAYTPTTPAPSITRSVILVTPALAAEWLKSNTHNRKLDPRAVTALAEMIAAGQWRLTHQGVAFGADGSLYDGQHRLHAIVQAGVPVSLEVTRGLSRKDLDVIDNGGKGTRRVDEVISITDGVKLTRSQTGILVAAAQLVAGGSLIGTKKQTPPQLRMALATYGEGLLVMYGALAGAHMAGVSSAPVVAALIVVWKTEPQSAVEFATALRTGENLGPQHPALILRNFLLSPSNRNQGGSARRDELALRTFSAFEAFIRGASRSHIRTSISARDRYVAAWNRGNGII